MKIVNIVIIGIPLQPLPSPLFPERHGSNIFPDRDQQVSGHSAAEKPNKVKTKIKNILCSHSLLTHRNHIYLSI